MRGQSVEVVLYLDPALPTVLADRTQLQQVLVNLAVNAVQAMADSPRRRLAISTSTAGDAILLVVEDEGPGLPPEPERLFDSFYTTKQGGMGMGLPVCRGIVEAHGGGIAAAPGQRGARFTITLPTSAIIPRSYPANRA